MSGEVTMRYEYAVEKSDRGKITLTLHATYETARFVARLMGGNTRVVRRKVSEWEAA